MKSSGTESLFYALQLVPALEAGAVAFVILLLIILCLWVAS